MKKKGAEEPDEERPGAEWPGVEGPDSEDTEQVAASDDMF